MRRLMFCLAAFLSGLGIGYAILTYFSPSSVPRVNLLPTKKKIIGFLPYWLLTKAKPDYSDKLTTLTYFGLTIAADGSIEKLSNPREEEPGWSALNHGRVQQFFDAAKAKGVARSIAAFTADQPSIEVLLSDPVTHAKNFVADILPTLNRFGATDINLDIESTKEASPSARQQLTRFVKGVREGLPKAITLSVDVGATDFVKNNLIDPASVAPYVDALIVMGYDFHYAGSFVTGPVAPVGGAGTVSEFDVATSIREAKKSIPAEKLILGVPLYGYEWETIDPSPRSAVIPGTGVVASSARIEALLGGCATCSSQLDADAQEPYIVYQDASTGTYHQMFYPDTSALAAKIRFADENDLEGVALWALGYESADLLDPLAQYKKSVYYFH